MFITTTTHHHATHYLSLSPHQERAQRQLRTPLTQFCNCNGELAKSYQRRTVFRLETEFWREVQRGGPGHVEVLLECKAVTIESARRRAKAESNSELNTVQDNNIVSARPSGEIGSLRQGSGGQTKRPSARSIYNETNQLPLPPPPTVSNDYNECFDEYPPSVPLSYA
ncbi:hypothetical protein J6590_049628 [Homalodisca vitripennis]|nr:hypothetical protein J6590_049628 [Homalodisca vitripennis]